MTTLNVWALPWPAARRTRRRMEAIGSELRRLRPDVAVFQEVWTAGARRALREAAPAAGLRHAWWGARRAEGGGLLVLSRWPIATAAYRRFEARGVPRRPWHGDALSGKGLCILGLRIEGADLWVVGVHLHARYDPRRYPEYEAYRVAQALEVAAAVRRLPAPAVVAGDLNATEDEPPCRLLRELAGLEDVAAVLDRRVPTFPAASGPGSASPGLRVDYVFCRGASAGSLRARAIGRVFVAEAGDAGAGGPLSDHAGLLAELELVPGRADAPPPASSAALARAAEVLAAGARRSHDRRRRERRLAALGLVAAAACLVAGRRRRGVAAVAGAALALLAPWATLRLRRRRIEQRAFAAATGRLRALGGATSGRPLRPERG